MRKIFCSMATIALIQTVLAIQLIAIAAAPFRIPIRKE